MVICKPTCYLHVGLHKTGTSSIQGFLSEHHSELETYDFFYPTFYLTQNKKLKSKLITAHHRLFRSFIDKEKLLTLAEAKASLNEYQKICLKKNQSLILSAENISGFVKQNFRFNNKSFLSILDFYLKGFKIIPVISFRNHINYYLSFYSERIRNTWGDSSIKISFVQFLMNQSQKIPYFFSDIYRELQSISFEKKIILLTFENSLKKGLTDSFLKGINCSFTEEIENINLRPSLSIISIELKRYISDRINSKEKNIKISKFLLSSQYKEIEKDFLLKNLKTNFNSKLDLITYIQNEGIITNEVIDIFNSDIDKLFRFSGLKLNHIKYMKQTLILTKTLSQDLNFFFEKVYNENLLLL